MSFQAPEVFENLLSHLIGIFFSFGSLSSMLPRFMLLFFLSCLVACSESSTDPPEIGTVSWNKDHDEVFEMAAKSKKPVLILFQEVPG